MIVSSYTFADEASNRKTPEFERLPVSSDAAAEGSAVAAAAAEAAAAGGVERGALEDGEGAAAGEGGDAL